MGGVCGCQPILKVIARTTHTQRYKPVREYRDEYRSSLLTNAGEDDNDGAEGVVVLSGLELNIMVVRDGRCARKAALSARESSQGTNRRVGGGYTALCVVH